MTEELNQSTQETGGEELSFAELFEMEENNKVVDVGDVAIGTIIGAEDDYFLVDVGDKAESFIPKSEFRLEEDAEVGVGDTFEVFVERRKDEEDCFFLVRRLLPSRSGKRLPRSRRPTVPSKGKLKTALRAVCL